VNKMDNSHFQEQARQDRGKLVIGIVVMTLTSLLLLVVGTGVGNMWVTMGILAPLTIAVFAGSGTLFLRLAKKMERDSFEEGMYLVMEGVPLNCTITDEKGTVLHCNDRSLELFKVDSKREYFEKLFGDFLPEFQPNGMRSMEMAGKHIQTAFKNGTDKFEWWHQLGPGKEQIPCAVSLAAASVYGMKRLLVFLNDMRKTHEIQRQEAALKERMQAVLDASPMFCTLLDENGNILDVNRAAESLFDIRDRRELINNYYGFCPEYQPDGTPTRQKADAEVAKALKTGSARYEWMYRRKDGTPLPTEEIVQRISVGGKNLIISYSRDLREQYANKEAEAVAQKRLNVMMDKLNGQLSSQSSAITESSAAIEEMIANTHSVSNTLSKNAQSVQDLQEAAAVGHSGLNEVATDIKEIARESESLLEINSVMQNIASQTNLLSMNAAIEAAHAGESGRGFAVVADEIRKLAESSSRQSKTIGAVLKKIKGSIDKITKSTDNVMTRFEAIDGGVKIVADQENEIMNAMAEQSAGSTQIIQAITQVNNITGQVKEDARQIVEAASKLGV